jgi:hypothetical protein
MDENKKKHGCELFSQTIERVKIFEASYRWNPLTDLLKQYRNKWMLTLMSCTDTRSYTICQKGKDAWDNVQVGDM